jgi:hypothetical protein
VILAQTLWGILENLTDTLLSIKKLLRPHGSLLISQHFPGAERQKYGRDIVDSPETFTEILKKINFTLHETLETNRATNHHWASLWTVD